MGIRTSKRRRLQDRAEHDEGFGLPHVPFNSGYVRAGLELGSDLEEVVEEGVLIRAWTRRDNGGDGGDVRFPRAVGGLHAIVCQCH